MEVEEATEQEFPLPPAGGADSWQEAEQSGFFFLPDSSTPPRTLLPAHL